MTNILAVALGGAAGSVIRYLFAEWGHRPGDAVPWGTLAANLLGCFLIGLLSVTMAGSDPSRETLRLATLVGLLGGFTTFSSYTWQAFSLMEQGQVTRGITYMVATNVVGLLVAWIGFRSGQAAMSA